MNLGKYCIRLQKFCHHSLFSFSSGNSRCLYILIYIQQLHGWENNDDNKKLGTDYISKLGIEFGFEQEAYGFYNECGGNSGFIFIKDGAIKEKKMAW